MNLKFLGKIYFLILILVVGLHSYADDVPTNKYVTINGAQYVIVNDAPAEMRPAYRDSSNLIWGNLMKDASNKTIQLNLSAARSLCERITYHGKNGRLPTKDELVRLRESMSANANPNTDQELATAGYSENSSFDESHPALPNLNELDWIWSSTLIKNGSEAFIFTYSQGEISSMAVTCSNCEVRCVVSE